MTESGPAETEPNINHEPLASPTAGNQKNFLIIVGLIVVLAVVGGLYFTWSKTRQSDSLAERGARAQAANEELGFGINRARPTSTPRPESTAVPQGPAPSEGEVMVVHRVPGDDYGRMAIRHADGTRTLLDQTCMRLHVAADYGICLSQNDSFVPTYTTSVFRSDNPADVIKEYSSSLPSRARISPNGIYSSVTAFATGTSYEDISGETTTIVTIDEIVGTSRLRSARQFEVVADDSSYQVQDAQFWGLTFADDDEFFITGYFGESPEILQGSLGAETMSPLGWKGSCPSLSPDAKTLVYKEMRDEGGFDLVAVDLDTDDRWILDEARSVDDQVEWLDNDTILYALHPNGLEDAVQPEFDIWMLDIAPGSVPELFLPNADSPAVMRSAE